MEKADVAYSELLNMMKEQGAKTNPVTLQLGEMLSPSRVRVGESLVLEHDDILIADHLLAGYEREINTPYVKDVNVTVATTISGTTATSTASVSEDKVSSIEFKTGLKKGDLVAIMKLTDRDKYIILAKVVGV